MSQQPGWDLSGSIPISQLCNVLVAIGELVSVGNVINHKTTCSLYRSSNRRRLASGDPCTLSQAIPGYVRENLSNVKQVEEFTPGFRKLPFRVLQRPWTARLQWPSGLRGLMPTEM